MLKRRGVRPSTSPPPPGACWALTRPKPAQELPDLGDGLPTSDCGSNACGEDSYHENSQALFERTKAALEREIDRPGETGVFRLYGDGATDADDPEELIDSPIEALDARGAAGYEYVIA